MYESSSDSAIPFLLRCIQYLVVVNILEHAVPFAAVAWHTHMTGVLPVVGRALDHALLGCGSFGARALLSYEQVMRDRILPLWD